jgi:hypothetical protein
MTVISAENDSAVKSFKNIDRQIPVFLKAGKLIESVRLIRKKSQTVL